MKTLTTVVVGLVLVFLDVGGADSVDWIPDPLGWVVVLVGLAGVRDLLPGYRTILWTTWASLLTSVLSFSPDSVAHLDTSLEWVFSLPTLAFCFLLSDALAEVCAEPLAGRFRLLRGAFLAVAALPVLIYGPGWEWLLVPTAVLSVVANLTLLAALWRAADQEEPAPAEDAPPVTDA